MTKTLNHIIFFPPPKSEYFFSNIGNQNIFLEKKHNPLKLNGRSLSIFSNDILSNNILSITDWLSSYMNMKGMFNNLLAACYTCICACILKFFVWGFRLCLCQRNPEEPQSIEICHNSRRDVYWLCGTIY